MDALLPLQNETPIVLGGSRLRPEDLRSWSRDHAPLIRDLLDQHGAVVLRGLFANEDFKAETAAVTEELQDVLGPALGGAGSKMIERSKFSKRVFSPNQARYSDVPIRLHHETAYQTKNIPRFIGFFCGVQAQGGESVIADSAETFDRLSASSQGYLMEHGIRYRQFLWNAKSIRSKVLRSYIGVSKTWQDVLSPDRDEAEALVSQIAERHQWRRHGLDIVRHTPGWTIHPQSGRPVFFNLLMALIANFGRNFLDLYPEEVRARQSLGPKYGWLLKNLGLSWVLTVLPRGATLLCPEGPDGNLPPRELVMDAARVTSGLERDVALAEGDFMLLDNLRVLHGRRPFLGARRLGVSMFGTHDLPERPVAGQRPSSAVVSVH